MWAVRWGTKRGCRPRFTVRLSTFLDAAVIVTFTMLILIGQRPAIDSPAVPPSIPETNATVHPFRPLLQRASTQADLLVALGQARERNLIRLRGEQNAMVEALQETDAWINANPERQSGPAFATYREGASAIRAAMNEAQEGFLRFDFDRVATANETLQTGAGALHRALDLLGDG